MSRRLPSASRLFVAAGVAFVTMLLPARFAAADQTYTLRPSRSAGELSRVKVSIKVGGELFLQSDGKQRAIPMSVDGALEYDEKLISTGDGQSPLVASYRSYKRANAILQLEKGSETPTLPESRRLVLARAGQKSITLVAPAGPLTREELDLIDVPANSLLLPEFLPDKPVQIGDCWRHSDELLAKLLELDVVSGSTAESKLDAVTDGKAKMSLAGNAQGAVGGVTAQIEFKAKYEFNLATRRIEWFALMIKDKRPVGMVNPGLDGIAKILVEIAPLENCPELAAERLAGLPDEGAPDVAQLRFRPAGSQFELRHDRRWFVTTADRDVAILRYMDRGELVAQCNISKLPDAAQSSDRSIGLEQFSEQVRTALGKRFERVVSASQSGEGDGGNHVYRVVCEGEQAQLPIRWIYYLVTSPRGDRLTLTFTLEEKLIEQFGAADEELIARLQLVDGAAEAPRQARRP